MELPITHVAVHRDGAIVTRRGTVRVDDGHVEVTRLPLLLDEASLQVTASTGSVISVRLELDVEGLHRAPPQALLDDVLAAEEAVAAAEAELGVLDGQLAFAREVAPAAPEEDVPVPDAARLRGWIAADEVLTAWAAEAGRARTALLERLDGLREARDAARLALAQASGEEAWRRWAPTRRVRVAIDGAGSMELTVTYRVVGATWTPAYALHVDGGFRTGKLVVRALVAQDTGEDWRGASVSLATSPLVRQVDAPRLRALRLGRAQPVSRSGWRPLPADLEELFPPDLEPGTFPQEMRPEERVMALRASWSESTVAALDTAIPRSKRRGRLAEPTPPPAMSGAPAGLEMPADAWEEIAVEGATPEPDARRSATPVPRRVAKKSAPAAPTREHLPEPPPEPEAGVRPSVLDYPTLRLFGWDAPPGRRGRLHRITLADEAVEAGAPPEALTHVDRARWGLTRRARDLLQRPLPAHHVLPEPIDGVDYRYDAVGGADIPSDGRFHSLSVFVEPLELDVTYRAVPREDPRVFRAVQARMAASRPLLPGPVDVIVDGALELTTPWRGSGQDSPIHLGLGPEDGLRVARNVRYREESKGLFGGERRVHTEVEVTVASSLPRAVRVELLDRIPVAADDSVKVELEHATPEATRFTGDAEDELLEGGLIQHVDIPPGGEAKATLHWHLTVGAKFEIEGGERRG